MTFRALLVSATVLLFGATFAPSAVAVPTVVDQYTEQVPTAGGELPGDQANQQGGSKNGSAPGNQSQAGSSPGMPLAGTGTPPGGDAGLPGTSQTGPADSGDQSTDESQQAATPPNGQSAVTIGGSGSDMGALFPLALAILGSLAVALVVVRRRGGIRTHTG